MISSLPVLTQSIFVLTEQTGKASVVGKCHLIEVGLTLTQYEIYSDVVEIFE